MMNKSLDELLETLLEQLQAEFGQQLLGVLVTGSHVHGTPHQHSDLDVHVVIDQPRRRRRNFMLEDVEIEMFINPPQQIRHYLTLERGVDQHMWAFGNVVYDPQGVLQQLQQKAQSLWEAGPLELSPSIYWRIRYMPIDLLRDFDDVQADDPATAMWLLANIIDYLVSLHYQLNRRWPEKLKRRLADLQRWDTYAAELVRCCWLDQSLTQRRAAVEALLQHVLAPVGGPVGHEWQSEWEDV